MVQFPMLERIIFANFHVPRVAQRDCGTIGGGGLHRFPRFLSLVTVNLIIFFTTGTSALMVQPGLRAALMTADVRKQGCQINRRRLVLRKLIFF